MLYRLHFYLHFTYAIQLLQPKVYVWRAMSISTIYELLIYFFLSLGKLYEQGKTKKKGMNLLIHNYRSTITLFVYFL